MIELIAAPGAWLLRGRATRAESPELKRLLSSEMAAGQPTPRTLDCSELEAIDVAGAQVLIAFKRSVAPGSFRFGPCAPAVLTYLKNCGLASALLES